MSQIIPFAQAQLPAHLQAAAAGKDANAIAATGTGGGGSVDHISIKGGRFHIVRNGQQPQTLQLFALQVIILQANSGMTKAFYEGAWNPDAEAEAPVCSSDDGVAPRADASKPQCNACAACPQNQFGSYINPQTQKQSKACQDKKTLAVVTPGAAGGEMLRLQVPAASLKDFGNFMRSLPVKYCYVITEIGFDTSVSFPKLTFKPVGYVSEQDAAAIGQRNESDEAKAIAGVAGFTPMGMAPAPAAAQLPAPPAYVQQPQQIPVQNVEQPVYQQQAPVQQPQQGGFGAQPQQQAYQQPVQQAPVQQPMQQPVQQPAYQQPAVDPSVAAIFAGQQQAPVQQQQAPVQQQPVQQDQVMRHPSGREYGKPSPGGKRRTKAEMAEDAAVGIGRAANETAEDDVPEQQPVQQAPVQQAQQPVQQAQVQQAPAQQPAQQGGFGAPVQQPVQQPYQQPAGQPQVIQGGAADAFAGWDD
ncbi:hypothetical protein [Pseudomonas sp.]|uniref:hypothetical protein n=1 Tax=Pseudomonas sp. TaxID=306 RepID=UPI00258F1271|nr:hypothetical protein [Pseudomonas sp.]